MKKDKCQVCGEGTNQGFNIDFTYTPICPLCENAIVVQSIQDRYLTHLGVDHAKETKI